LIINIGMIFPNFQSKKLLNVNIWLLWIHLEDHFLWIPVIKDISGWYLFLSLITNHYKRFSILFWEDIWNISKLKFKSLLHLLFKVLWNYILLLHKHLEKLLLISIMNSILDIFQMFSMDYWLLNQDNFKTLKRWLEHGFMKVKERIVIDLLLWIILLLIKLLCLIWLKNHLLNIISLDSFKINHLKI
jgi:hypothetical protein